MNLKTSKVPTGSVKHTKYGERPWDYNVYRWTTTGHPVFYKMVQNKFGGYDVVQNLRIRPLSWEHTVIDRSISEREALNILITQQTEVMRQFGGYKNSLTTDDVSKEVKSGKYPKDHIFGYAKEHPEVLINWVEDYAKPLASKTAAKRGPAAPGPK